MKIEKERCVVVVGHIFVGAFVLCAYETGFIYDSCWMSNWRTKGDVLNKDEETMKQ